MRAGWVSVAVAGALAIGVAACGGSDTTVAGGPPLPRDYFGMNAQIVAQAAQAGKLDYADHQAARIQDLSVGFVRSAFDWARVEPDPPAGDRHAYDFSSLDGWVEVLARHRLRWLVTVKGGPIPAWAADRRAAAEGCGTNAPPAGTDAYAALTEALVRRYGRDGTFWAEHPELPYEPITDYEVWNEPNFGRLWCPRPDPAAYARLYLAAHRAIEGVDPKARVLLGGLAPFPSDEAGPPAKLTPRTFMEQAVRAAPELRRQTDAVAVHPYGATPDAVVDALRRLRDALDASGLQGVPMLANEVGWHTHSLLGLPPVPEDQRADYFRETIPRIARSGCDVIGVAAHTWVTLEQRERFSEDWYGMADPVTGEPYPSATAYAEQVDALEAGKPLPAAAPACEGARSGGGR